VIEPEQVLVISSWGQKWLRYAWNRVVNGREADRFARDVIEVFDAVDDDPLTYAEEVEYTDIKTVSGFCDRQKVELSREVRKRRKRALKKGCRSKFAAAIAKLAYNKFGERPVSDANVLVTRKWLQKLLEEAEYKDLRTVDKNLAIDRALFLSFIPTNSFRKMKLAVSTRAWEQRVENSSVFGGVFGRVFGFTRDAKALRGAFTLE
jgi:hypothetical protein